MINERYDTFTYADDGTGEGTSPQPVSIEENGGKRTVIGYAIVWGAISSPRRSIYPELDGKRHQFVRGSITWANIVHALWHHSYAVPLAVTTNQTVRLAEDDYGVRAEIDLDDTTDGIDAYKRVVSQLVRGMSFSAALRRENFRITSDPTVVQPFNVIGTEVTLTVIPAMTATSIMPAEDFSKQQKEKSAIASKNKLNTVRLALLRPIN